jgi:hypothetical protein
MLRPNGGRESARINRGRFGGANGPPAAAVALKSAPELKGPLIELLTVENIEFEAKYAGTVVHKSPALVKGIDPDNALVILLEEGRDQG